MANNLYSDAYLAWFDKHGVKRPDNIPHVHEADIEKNMQRLMPHSWKLEGNKLIGMTDVGPLVQFIDPNYILTGTDDKGLPMFKKVV